MRNAAAEIERGCARSVVPTSHVMFRTFYRENLVESARLSRRLHLLRGWSDGRAEQVFVGSA